MTFKSPRYLRAVFGLFFVMATTLGCTPISEDFQKEEQSSEIANFKCRKVINAWNEFRESFLNLVFWSGPQGVQAGFFGDYKPSPNFYDREDLREDWSSIYEDLKHESFEGHLPLNNLNSKIQSYYLNIETLMIGKSASDYEYPTVELINGFIQTFNPLVDSSNAYCQEFGFSNDG